jgi:polysaccharide export outer membrane protein
MRLALALSFFLSLFSLSSGAAQGALATDASNYALLPGDLLRIQIWREEELSGEFLIDERGKVILPLLGERAVAGIPIEDLRDQLIEAYRFYFSNPSISIMPLRRISVQGEVGAPGLYPVDPTISLGQLLAIAGGITESGKWDRVHILRDGQVFQERIGISESVQNAGIQSGDQVVVERRSWIAQNGLSALSVVLTAIALLRIF